MENKIYTTIMLLGLVTTVQEVHDWVYYASIIGAATVCYFVTYAADTTNPNRPTKMYRLSCSIAASFMAYFLFPSVHDFELDILSYKFHPFTPIQLFVGLSSYFGISIFKEINAIKSFGFSEWRNKIANAIKAKPKKQNDELDS